MAEPSDIRTARAELRDAEAALRASEERYQLLFNSIDQGFCTIAMIFDEQGTPVDYEFIEVNRAFEITTGLTDVVGQRMRELRPNHEQYWFDIYGRIALTGVPERFEHQAGALERWYNVYAFRVSTPEQRRVAVLFEDITQRKLIERELQEANHRKDEFLATLSHELRNPLAPLRNGMQIARGNGQHVHGEAAVGAGAHYPTSQWDVGPGRQLTETRARGG